MSTHWRFFCLAASPLDRGYGWETNRGTFESEEIRSTRIPHAFLVHRLIRLFRTLALPSFTTRRDARIPLNMHFGIVARSGKDTFVYPGKLRCTPITAASLTAAADFRKIFLLEFPPRLLGEAGERPGPESH